MEEARLEAGECSHSNGAVVDVDNGGKHGSDEVVAVDDLTKSMKEELASKRYEPNYSATILRVPEEMRNDDPGAYSPKVVSIGPFHRSRQNVQHMEELKWHYLRKFLDRKPENDLQMYVKEMKKIEEWARSCYKGNIKMEPEEFVRMMVLDGCFIVQLLLQLQLEDGVALEDPIYCDRWTLPRVGHDLLLLENQLPFVILEQLWGFTGFPGDLTRSVLNFFRNLLPKEHDLELPQTTFYPDHMLHLIHSSLRPTPFHEETHVHEAVPCAFTDPHDRYSRMSGLKPPPPPPETIPTVTELQEAGVKFKRREAKSFLDIKFEHGLLEIPRLTVSDISNSLFRNFIALEQCLPWSSAHFTSYCIFMDSLINTPRDVQLLYQSDIIKHVLGSDEEVAILFNKLCKGITWDFKNSYLANASEGVIKHSQLKWPKWRAKLVRDYFSNPWAILSLAAAIFVIIIASGQTYFAVFGYFRPPRS